MHPLTLLPADDFTLQGVCITSGNLDWGRQTGQMADRTMDSNPLNNQIPSHWHGFFGSHNGWAGIDYTQWACRDYIHTVGLQGGRSGVKPGSGGRERIVRLLRLTDPSSHRPGTSHHSRSFT